MTARRSRIAAAIAAAVAVLGDVTYRIVKQDLGDLANARSPHNATALGGVAIFLLGCIAYLAAAAIWQRRGSPGRPPLGAAGLLTFIAVFAFVNAAPDRLDSVPGAAYFVLQTLFWDIAGILLLFVARTEHGPLVLGLRIYAVALVAFQSVVGFLGATYAGDSMMADFAGAIGCVSILTMLALALRRAWFERAEPATP